MSADYLVEHEVTASDENSDVVLVLNAMHQGAEGATAEYVVRFCDLTLEIFDNQAQPR